MSDTLVLPPTGPSEPSDSSEPLLLEELIEPLELPAAPEPLPVEAMVFAPDGTAFRILGLLKTEAQAHLYEAEAEETAKIVWLREAATETSAARLRREAEVLEGLECPMFPRLLACFESE